MGSAIFPAIIGIVLMAIGITNMKGNLSSIHRYHRHRVAEEDKQIYGKLVGMGTAIVGGALIVFGLLSFLSARTGNDVFTIAGSVILLISLVPGLGLNFYAMIKYNKGIF